MALAQVAARKAERALLREAEDVMLGVQAGLKGHGVDPELAKLMAEVFSVVPPDSVFFLRAAKQALDHGQAIWDILKRQGAAVRHAPAGGDGALREHPRAHR